jgi:hypothetical protein
MRMIDGPVRTESGRGWIERLRQSRVVIPSLPLRVLTHGEWKAAHHRTS